MLGCTPPATPSILGKWNDQQGTPWEFTADGKVIIKDDASATYTLGDKQSLTIDFHDPQSLVISYTYEISEGKLILRPVDAKGTGALPIDWDEPTVLIVGK